MSETPMSRPSGTDWARVDALTDEEIDTSDIPPLTEEWFERATIRLPDRPIELTLALDPDVLAWFLAQDGDWRRRLNEALRDYVEAQKTRT